MQRVCAWCGRQYGDIDLSADGTDLVTHGICAQCDRFFGDRPPSSLRDFLNAYEEPILCVDSGYSVLTANDAAVALLACDRSEVRDLLCGEMVLCRWAHLPDGCGTHEHCLACTLRRAVGSAFSGEAPVVRQPAYVDRLLTDGTHSRVRLSITCERRADVVLIRIDDLQEEPAGEPVAEPGGGAEQI
jgi:hypothetical protein